MEDTWEDIKDTAEDIGDFFDDVADDVSDWFDETADDVNDWFVSKTQCISGCRASQEMRHTPVTLHFSCIYMGIFYGNNCPNNRLTHLRLGLMPQCEKSLIRH